MKASLKIVLLIIFFQISACQDAHKTDELKKNVTIALKNLDSSSAGNDEKDKIIDTLYNQLLEHKNDSINRNLYFKIASKYYSIDKYSKFLTTVKKVHNLSVEAKDDSHIAKSLYYFGDYYDEESQLDSAFNYYSQSEKVYSQIKDTLNIGRTKLYKAGILFDAGIFSESEAQAVEALRLLIKTNNTRLIYECYVILAISLKELNNSTESLKYFDLALKQLEKQEKEGYPKSKIERSRISCFNNIGRVYEKLKNYPEAIRLYKKGLIIKDIKNRHPKSYAMLLDNLAYSKMKIGDFKGVDKLLFESLKIRDSLDVSIGIASSKINLGEYYLYKKDKNKGLTYLKEGLKLSKEIKSNLHTIESLKLLMANDLENKNFYTSQYLKINDSLQKVERITKDKFARIEYETDQVEEKNEILSRRNTIIIISSAVIILFLGIFIIIYRLRVKNKELSFIKEQQEANERIYQLLLKQQSETECVRNEERNRIAMELHDGIVNSVFTTRFNLIQLDSTQDDKKEQLVKELEKTENEIRRVSHNLTQNQLFEDNSFTDVIKNLVESQQNQFNTKFDFSVDKLIDWSPVSSSNKIHIYRIIQEALQNSNKYSNAERCYIMLLKTGDKITIRIWDNGIGFNVEKIKEGIGLRNIKERAKSLNGEMKIISEPGKGTTIEVIF
ncbi:sensor histidine kinase [uncultured Flavobacterium sp.]|uniref:tetratricopeptide repeat-containing sensor histidine kinase n=1 Tax=uncultured Flavobacterium sp. TaxID=165435 RepID=UPI003081CBB0